MGNGGYWIIVFDGYGDGLVMINPAFLEDGYDAQGNPRNWFQCSDAEKGQDADILAKHGIVDPYYAKVVWG